MNKRVLTRAAVDPESLTELIAARLSLSHAAARDLVDRGAVWVAGERAQRSRRVSVGDKVVVHTAAAAVASPIVFVHRDDWIAVVDKPVGVPSQAEPSQSSGALDAQLQRLVGGAARAMHRLDKEASGLVLFALRQRVYAPLQRALTAGAIERRYLAIVDGQLRGEGAIRLRIGRHPTDRRRRAPLPENAPAGEPACSHFRALAHASSRDRSFTAVELRLETGRTHQLRVHLSGIGHPIVGDSAYGGSAYERMCLHAYALELAHPIDERPLRLHAPLPEPLVRLVPGLTTLLT